MVNNTFEVSIIKNRTLRNYTGPSNKIFFKPINITHEKKKCTKILVIKYWEEIATWKRTLWSSGYLILSICLSSLSSYDDVGMMMVLSSRSRGIPWGEVYEVPRIFVIPLQDVHMILLLYTMRRVYRGLAFQESSPLSMLPVKKLFKFNINWQLFSTSETL